MIFRLLAALCALLLAAPVAWADEDDDTESDQRRRRAGPSSEADIRQQDLAQAVLIVPLAGETSESMGVGVLLESFLRDQLDTASHLDVLGLDQCPAVDDIGADLYYEGCPAGNELGCQFVIGEVARVDRVVGGRVTVREDGRYRVVVTILSVALADVEYTYAVDLAAGEEDLLPATVQLALDRLAREKLLAPMRTAEEKVRARDQAMQEAATEEERRLVARMDAELEIDELEALQLQRSMRRDRVTEKDLSEIKSVEGTVREWDEMGLTEAQYLSWKNSRLDWDVWRWRWSGHRFMIIGSVYGGFVGGSVGLRYYGKSLSNPQLSGVADSYAWQRVEQSTSANLGGNIGFGILRNLDVDVGFHWSQSRVWIRLDGGGTEDAPDGSGWQPKEDNRPTEWQSQRSSTWAGEVMVRFFALTVPIVRPTVAAGFSWLSYPNLYGAATDPEAPNDRSGIPQSFPRLQRLTDFGVQLEGGVQFDFNRFFGLFLRVPVFIGINPARTQESEPLPRPIIRTVEEVGKAPFGYVRVLVGVQGRVLGKPLKPKQREYYEEVEDDL
jgi:hypothetical protein